MVVLITAAGLGAYSLYFTDTVRKATLIVKNTPVEVDAGHGFSAVTGTVLLNEGATVRTGAGGKATIVLYESAFVQVDQNAKVKIASLLEHGPRIVQPAGSTFTKFTGLSGMQTLETQTENAIATVRGTSYKVAPNGIFVLDGTVGVTVNGGQEIPIEGGNAYAAGNGRWTRRPLTAAERSELLDRFRDSIEDLKAARQAILDKHATIISAMQRAGNMTPEQFAAKLESVDSGNGNIDGVISMMPIQVPPATRFIELTKQIRKSRSELVAFANR